MNRAAGRRWRDRWAMATFVAVGLLLARDPTFAADDPACAPILAVLEAAPGGFRALRSAEYSTKFESWQSRQTLPGFDGCWVDDITRGFWCLLQAPGVEVAGRAAAAQAAVLERCWPGVPTKQFIETGDNNVTRWIQDWALPGERRLRLVHRKPNSGPGLSAVFLYVY